MNIERLTKMANQIGTFFEAEAEADCEAAADNIADHMKRFWDPRMRNQFVNHVTAGRGAELLPIVVIAIERNRNALLGVQQGRSGGT